MLIFNWKKPIIQRWLFIILMKLTRSYSLSATSTTSASLNTSLTAKICIHTVHFTSAQQSPWNTLYHWSQNRVPALNHLIKRPVCVEIVAGASGKCYKSSTNLIKVGIMRGLETRSHAMPFHCILQLYTNTTRCHALTHVHAHAPWSIPLWYKWIIEDFE